MGDVNSVVFPKINNGVYCAWIPMFRAGAAGKRNPEALPFFVEACRLVKEGLAFLEHKLAAHNQTDGPVFLLGGDKPTLADVRAFPHLFRYDSIYWDLMMLKRGPRIFGNDEFPNLQRWIRDTMFRGLEIKQTCDLQLATRMYLSLSAEQSDLKYDQENGSAGLKEWVPNREEWAKKRQQEGMSAERIETNKL